MGQRITVVDAFTEVAFGGNPAAVCVLMAPTTEAWMQAVAREMAHSETAFCLMTGEERLELRWFAPVGEEVGLCGHATLAAAHVLWEEGWLAPQRAVRFSTRSGELSANPLGRQVELDLPARPPSETDPAAGLIEALGVSPAWVGRDVDDYVLLLENEEAVKACKPDFAALSKIDTRGVVITASADHDQVDFVSRFFAPRFGIDEDPVTGSAHCALTPLWSARLGKQQLVARQLSARGGELEVELLGERVKLRGTCVTTLRGNLSESPPRASSWTPEAS
ncbi:MAG: PhzF family phenazine biosynthesis protein [Myxococcales bacterium]